MNRQIVHQKGKSDRGQIKQRHRFVARWYHSKSIVNDNHETGTTSDFNLFQRADKIQPCSISTYPDIVDEEFLEAIRTDMTTALLCTVTNIGHLVLTFEPPPHPVVNTLGLAPASLKQQTRIHISNTTGVDIHV